MNCRHCKAALEFPIIDLGFQPPSNSYTSIHEQDRAEVTYPLKVSVCTACWLVQTEDYVKREEFFNEGYAYFSSTSASWLDHSKKFAQQIIEQLQLTENSNVIEIASNDGYLLRNFVKASIPCLGIEPTESTAQAAMDTGVPTIMEFFGTDLAKKINKKFGKADLIVANNVLAHVPDINDFSEGLEMCLKENGVVSVEFPHLINLIEQNQFDTIYHEHYSYLSLTSVVKIFGKAGLRVFKVDKLETHGGSLRVYACKVDSAISSDQSVSKMLDEENHIGVETTQFYQKLEEKAQLIKLKLLEFLITLKLQGKSVSAYGAAAKGNTLLNFAGVKPDLLPVVYDASESKQGKFLPGSHIPIKSPKELISNPTDYVIILPWNISDEISKQLSDLKKIGTQFVTLIPKLEVK